MSNYTEQEYSDIILSNPKVDPIFTDTPVFAFMNNWDSNTIYTNQDVIDQLKPGDHTIQNTKDGKCIFIILDSSDLWGNDILFHCVAYTKVEKQLKISKVYIQCHRIGKPISKDEALQFLLEK